MVPSVTMLHSAGTKTNKQSIRRRMLAINGSQNVRLRIEGHITANSGCDLFRTPEVPAPAEGKSAYPKRGVVICNCETHSIVVAEQLILIN